MRGTFEQGVPGVPYLIVYRELVVPRVYHCIFLGRSTIVCDKRSFSACVTLGDDEVAQFPVPLAWPALRPRH